MDLFKPGGSCNVNKNAILQHISTGLFLCWNHRRSGKIFLGRRDCARQLGETSHDIYTLMKKLCWLKAYAMNDTTNCRDLWDAKKHTSILKHAQRVRFNNTRRQTIL